MGTEPETDVNNYGGVKMDSGEIQRAFLQWLGELSPKPPTTAQWVDFRNRFSFCSDVLLHLGAAYKNLEELGLVAKGGVQEGADSYGFSLSAMGLTAKGRAYLGKDGGLYKEVNTITVRLDEESIKAMLVSVIESLPATKAEKGVWKKAIESAPTAMMSALVQQLFISSCDKIPLLVKSVLF